jgi:hypothetical protein
MQFSAVLLSTAFAFISVNLQANADLRAFSGHYCEGVEGDNVPCDFTTCIPFANEHSLRVNTA